MQKDTSIDIQELRKQIDNLDEVVISLIEARIGLSGYIRWEKRKLGLPIRDKNREATVINHVRSYAEEKRLDVKVVERIYNIIIPYCRHAQEAP